MLPDFGTDFTMPAALWVAGMFHFSPSAAMAAMMRLATRS